MLNKRLVTLVALLVVLDVFSTYLCTLYYPAELEFNPLLRYLLLKYSGLALALYAPIEFIALTLLLTAYSKILTRLGVKNTFKYCIVVLSVFYLIVTINFLGGLVK